VSIVRGVGPQCIGPSCSSTSCDGLGRIELSLGAASDDVSAAENIGYRLRVVEGALPDGLAIDETRRADGIADGTASLVLLWIDEAEDEQEPFDFVLGVTPIDEAGNEGEELSISLADEGRAAGGCATVHGGGAGALALGFLAAAARGRRSRGARVTPTVVLSLALLAGCHVTSRPGCDVVEREVADDDALGDLSFTVTDLVAAAAGTFTVDLRDAAAALHTTTVSTVRGEGPATFFDATYTSVETRRLGFGRDTLMIGVSCDDTVEVPMTIDVVSTDGAIDVSGDALAWNERTEDPPLITVAREIDPATDVIPPPEGDAEAGHIEVQYRDGALTSVSAWWDGKGGEYEQAIEGP
jgi:hypothetical protein